MAHDKKQSVQHEWSGNALPSPTRDMKLCLAGINNGIACMLIWAVHLLRGPSAGCRDPKSEATCSIR